MEGERTEAERESTAATGKAATEPRRPSSAGAQEQEAAAATRQVLRMQGGRMHPEKGHSNPYALQ